MTKQDIRDSTTSVCVLTDRNKVVAKNNLRGHKPWIKDGLFCHLNKICKQVLILADRMVSIVTGEQSNSSIGHGQEKARFYIESYQKHSP